LAHLEIVDHGAASLRLVFRVSVAKLQLVSDEIVTPRLALRNHGACEPPCAAVGKPALPVQSSTAARPLHFLISGMAKLSASATEDETKAA
jgi:hypothetical protein